MVSGRWIAIGTIVMFWQGVAPTAEAGEVVVAAPTQAAAGASTPSTSGNRSRGNYQVPGAVGGGWSMYWYGGMYGPRGTTYVTTPSPLMLGPMVPPDFQAGVVVPRADEGEMQGSPMRPTQRRTRRVDFARAEQFVTLGDRHFRMGSTKRASERYEQAARANPSSAEPRVRLAQLAFVRGKYSEAADRVREALTTDPGWLLTAPDIRRIYGEPGDFHKPIAALESHLQAEPGDRDGWFLLGAQLYLSGETRKAGDIFLRLTDRKADPSLAAFLDATRKQEPEKR
ncbi:tetratricopeptide repeat protein [Isosphaeraceae bacterium EP7]